jgi:hypothetical protein
MNVKLGDLAIVTRGNSVGKICTVNFAMGIILGEFHWSVEFKDAVPTMGEPSKTPFCPDSWLRPVSGLPDTEQTDQQEPIKEIA